QSALRPRCPSRPAAPTKPRQWPSGAASPSCSRCFRRMSRTRATSAASRWASLRRPKCARPSSAFARISRKRLPTRASKASRCRRCLRAVPVRPMVMVGLGGVFVEVLKDTAVRIAPIDNREAHAMLAELRGAALLGGVRGRAAVDRDAIAQLLVRISEFAARRAEIREMDLNPIAAYASGLCVLDARILLDREVKDAAHGQLPDAEGAALQARRQENLRRALKPRTAIVIGDRGS